MSEEAEISSEEVSKLILEPSKVALEWFYRIQFIGEQENPLLDELVFTDKEQKSKTKLPKSSWKSLGER